MAVLFFGYTYCPDVCPFTLAKMKQMVGQMGDAGDDVAVIFASVDPHRDTIEKLANYVPNFDTRFIGLRLDFDEIEAIKDDYGLSVPGPSLGWPY